MGEACAILRIKETMADEDKRTSTVASLLCARVRFGPLRILVAAAIMCFYVCCFVVDARSCTHLYVHVLL